LKAKKKQKMNKNDIVTLEIVDVTDTGSGIGKVENTVVFVPSTTVGDTVSALIIKVNKNYSIGKLKEIIIPSKNRINPDCECFLQCGGCAYRHITYDAELLIKQKRVEDCIKRIGKIDIEPENIVSNKEISRYRNKAQYPIGENGIIGFYGLHSHRIVPSNDCALQPVEFSLAVEALKAYIKKTNVSVYNSETDKGLIRHFYLRQSTKSGDIMAVVVANGEQLPNTALLIESLKNKLGEKLKSVQLNVNKKQNNVILGNKNILLYGEKYIKDEICGISVRLSPNSFYQVNRNMAELLYNKAKEYASPNGKVILDLYCGTGTIGLTMARDAKSVIGVEIVKEAIEDANKNALDNGVSNIRFICDDASNAVVSLKEEKIKPDVVIVDPPRKGCDIKLIETIANGFAPERVVYVSCDPATLARDIKLFGEYSYKLVEYTPFDLFPRTAHVETVVLLSKVNTPKG